MGALIRPIDALLPRAAQQFGGKARDLAVLVRAGFPVPATYALSGEAAARALSAILPAELSPARLVAEADAQLAKRARAAVLAASLPREVESALRQAYRSLQLAAADGVAVRSSSTLEDRLAASAAGMHVSVLNVRSEQALMDAVRQCWASAVAPAAAGYAHTMGLSPDGATGVLVQAMVPADVAGVLFTVNPLTGADDEIVINATFGLGTAITDGQVSPDTYRIDKHSGWIRDRVIGQKQTRVVLAERGGLRQEALPPALQHAQTLDEHMLERLVALGRRIEQQFGRPRDIEFAIAGDSIYVLQARAVTALPVRRGAVRGRRKNRLAADPGHHVWSNLNVGEALPGVATPLTWSVLSAFSELGFQKAFAALGCSLPRDVQLVGNFRGRIYLNLSELSAIASQVPGLRPQVVLELGGGGEAGYLEVQRTQQGNSSGFLVRLPFTAARFARSHLGFRARLQQFEQSFSAERARLQALDLRILPAAALDETLSDVQRLLDQTGGMLLTAYGGLLSALLPLRAALHVLRGEQAESILQRLLSAIEDVESADPGREALAVADAFAHDEAARAALFSDPALPLDALPPGEAHAAVESFLLRHGHRGVREAELAEPRWREQPQLLLDCVRIRLAHEGGELERVLEGRVRELRHGAGRELRALPAPTRPALRALVTVVRHYLRMRERLRSHVVRVLGFLRRIALDVSRRIRVREPDAPPDAAFFLTLGELHSYLRGEVRVVAALVQTRRAQYARDRALPDPPSTFVGFPPALLAEPASGELLCGLGASAGVVEGVARVLSSPAEVMQLRTGEILVVPCADVGWAPVFVLSSGLVTEVGGPLSHACVVAREYGLPAVVNVPNVTRRLRSGDRVRVDGSAGTVRRLNSRA